MINEKKYLEAINNLDNVMKNCERELFDQGGHDKTFERLLEEGEDLSKEAKYRYAVQCYEYGDYTTARKWFMEVIDYKDSERFLSEMKD